MLGGARRFGAHRGRKGAGAYRGGRPPTACYDISILTVEYFLKDAAVIAEWKITQRISAFTSSPYTYHPLFLLPLPSPPSPLPLSISPSLRSRAS